MVFKSDIVIKNNVTCLAISEKTSEKIGVTARTIESDLAQLKKLVILTREGGRKEGKWVVNEKYQ